MFIIFARLKNYLFYLIYGLFTDIVKKIIPLRINNEGNILIIRIKVIKKREKKFKMVRPGLKVQKIINIINITKSLR